MATPPGPNGNYTLNGDFDQGQYFNVGHPVPHQLQLEATYPFKRLMWIAVTGKGTVVRIDTETGKVQGEYWGAPQPVLKSPSRTTVDKNGNVWVTNRFENTLLNGVPMGSVVKIGLSDNDQCVDRNGNNVIDTSTGLGDVRPWPNTGGVDTDGGVDTAEDECILLYVRTSSTSNRHVSVTPSNDVWVSGTGIRDFVLLHGATGAVLRVEKSINCGGYGGLIDKNGVIWSSHAGPLLRWDTALPLTPANAKCIPGDMYGLCRDGAGNVWSSTVSATVKKFAPDGTLLATYANPSAGGSFTQGCAIDGNDHVWVANGNDGPNSVSHFLPSGVFVGAATVGGNPTGVAVDGGGNVWSTNFNTGTASRVNPALGPVGGGGAKVGATDITTVFLGGTLYNYSDMTGSLLLGPPDSGTWVVIHNSTVPSARWGRIQWTSLVPAQASLRVFVSSSHSAAPGSFSAPVEVTKPGCFSVPEGQYLRVRVHFARPAGGDSPILYDLAVGIRPRNLAEARALESDSGPPTHVILNSPGQRHIDNGAGASGLFNGDYKVATAKAMREAATAKLTGCSDAYAWGQAEAASVNILGLIEASGLYHEANATYNASAQKTSTWAVQKIGTLKIQGRSLNMDPGGNTQTHVIPFVGRLVVHERATVLTAQDAEYRGALLHYYGDNGAEVVVSAVHVHAGARHPTL